MMEYSFFLEGNQVYPIYDDNFEIGYDKERGEKFMRQVMNGELTFWNDHKNSRLDYDTIKAYADNRELNLEIYTQCSGTPYFSGYFGKYDGNWDEDNCTFTVKATTDDKYRCVKRVGGDEYNILNVGSQHDVTLDMSFYEFVTCEDERVTLYSPHTGPTWGFTDAGGNYNFGTSAAPENKPYGGLISDGVPIVPVAPNWNRNINACGCLPDQGDPAGSDDRGFVVYSTVIDQDFTGAGSPRDFNITTVWFREVVWNVVVDGVPESPGVLAGWGGDSDYVGLRIIDGIQMAKWGREPQVTHKWTTIQGAGLPCSWTYDTTILPDYTETIAQCRPLRKVIEWMMESNQMGCGLTYRSTFFDNDPLPPEAPSDIDTIITASSGDNYVTEETNKLNNLMIAQKSDVKICLETPGSGCGGSEFATKGLLSFNTLAEILYKMFQVFPYIDSEGYLRFEHERFFNQSLGSIDLTTQLNRFADKEYSYHTNKYRYKVEDTHQVERWTFMEQNTPDFIGEVILYEEILSNTRDKKIDKEYSVPNVTTDVRFIFDIEQGTLTGDSISSDGFVILQTYYDSGYVCENEDGALSGVSQPNNHLSVANLQDKYWKWGRIQPRGRMNQDHWNNTWTTFESSMKLKEQVEIEFDLCCTEFDTTKLIKTALGNGEISKASHNLSSGMMKVVLNYN